jgi:hypothetical protein
MSLKQDALHPMDSSKGLPSGNLQGGEDVTPESNYSGSPARA